MTPREFTPREYQSLIIDHVINNMRSGIWSFMGSGKTVSTMTAVDILQLAGHETKPAFVLAPKRVAKSTWPTEAKKWKHLQHMEVQPIVGTVEQRIAALRNTNAAMFTMNYENLPWLMEHLNGKWPFGMVIPDESTKLKGFRLKQGGQRSQALGNVAKRRQHDRWLNLTGTPAPNGLIDLWGQTWFLDFGERLGRTFDAFKQRWFYPNHNGYGVAPHDHAQAEIEDKLRSLCLALKAEDYFDIREPIRTKVYVDLPSKVRQHYDEMEEEFFMEIEGHEIEAFNSAAKSGKLLQLCNGAVYIDPDVNDDNAPRAKAWKEVHDEKLQALESIAEEWNGSPILVAYHFKSDLARLKKAFPKGRVLDDKSQTIDDWNDGKIPMLFVHPASAGHGLNLQDGGHILVFFGLNWNLEEHEQVIERLGPVRQAQAGHNRAVYLYFIMARDSMDDVVYERLLSKLSVEQALINAMRVRKIKR